MRRLYKVKIANDLVRKKTTLTRENTKLVLDLVLFFFKKKLIEEQKVKVPGFGIFYIKRTKNKHIRVKFRLLEKLKVFINEGNFNIELYKNLNYQRTRYLNKIFSNVRRIVKIKSHGYAIHFVFRLFILSILHELANFKNCRILYFGLFYLYKVNYKKNNVAGIPKTKFRDITVRFKPSPKLIEEIARNKQLHFLTRTKKILKYNKKRLNLENLEI